MTSFGGKGNLRGRVFPQGQVTVKGDMTQNEIDKRRRNGAKSRTAIETKSKSVVQYFPYGDSDAVHCFLQGELALSFKGRPAVSANQMIEVFSYFNGLPYFSDNPQGVLDEIDIVGAVKNHYHPLNPKMAKTGIAIIKNGTACLFHVSGNDEEDKPSILYPGDWVTLCVTRASVTGTRNFPLFSGIPTQKILPGLKAVDRGFMDVFYEDVSQHAYGANLKKIPPGDGLALTHNVHQEKYGQLTRFERVAQREKCALITSAMRVVEVLLRRKIITINNDLVVNASEEKYRELPPLDRDDSTKFYNLQKLVGLASNQRIGSLNHTPSEVEQDLFFAQMWPKVPPNHMGSYKPAIFDSQQQRLSTDDKKVNDSYGKYCSQARVMTDTMRFEAQSQYLRTIVGTVLSHSDPNQDNPTVDVLISNGIR